MLRAGSIPLTYREQLSLRKLSKRRDVLGVTRRDPGEQGPIVATTSKGVFLIGTDGRSKRVRWWSRG